MWAAVYGVARGRTRLKLLGSSMNQALGSWFYNHHIIQSSPYSIITPALTGWYYYPSSQEEKLMLREVE